MCTNRFSNLDPMVSLFLQEFCDKLLNFNLYLLHLNLWQRVKDLLFATTGLGPLGIIDDIEKEEMPLFVCSLGNQNFGNMVT